MLGPGLHGAHGMSLLKHPILCAGCHRRLQELQGPDHSRTFQPAHQRDRRVTCAVGVPHRDCRTAAQPVLLAQPPLRQLHASPFLHAGPALPAIRLFAAVGANGSGKSNFFQGASLPGHQPPRRRSTLPAQTVGKHASSRKQNPPLFKTLLPHAAIRFVLNDLGAGSTVRTEQLLHVSEP
jgi:hypothetical protein